MGRTTPEFPQFAPFFFFFFFFFEKPESGAFSQMLWHMQEL